MGCWDTSCLICSVMVSIDKYAWTQQLTAVLRTKGGYSVHDCYELLNYGGTGEFFAKSHENPIMGWNFSFGEGWSEYPKLGIVAHTDCFNLYVQKYGPVYRSNDPLYTGNKHLERLMKMKLTPTSWQFHNDDDYKDRMFMLESPLTSLENKTRIEMLI